MEFMSLKISRLEQVCFCSLLVLVFWIPIPLASNRVWSSTIFEIWSAILLFFVLFCYHQHGFNFIKRKLVPFLWLIVPISIFQLWCAVQLISWPILWLDIISSKSAEIYRTVGVTHAPISLDPFSTELSLLRGIAFLFVIITSALLINTVKRMRLVLTTLVCSGVFQALYGAFEVLLAQKYSLVFGYEIGPAATGSFLYKNHFANYLLLCLCLGVGLIVGDLHASPSGSWVRRLLRWSEGALSRKMFWRLAIIIMVIGLVMSHSRMGNSAFFASTVIGSLVALACYKDKPRALMAFIISLLLIDTVVVGSLFGLNQLQQEIVHTSFATETRDEVVEWSLPIIADFPYTGTGMGSYASVFSSYTQRAIGYYDHAHNEYIEFAVEAGVPMTLMLGGMCLWALWLCVRVMKTHNSKTLKGAALGCFMAIVGMLLHIAVDFNLQAPANAMTFILILTLVGCFKSIQAQRRLLGSSHV